MKYNGKVLLLIGVEILLVSFLIIGQSVGDDSQLLIPYEDIAKPIPGVPIHPIMDISVKQAEEHHKKMVESPHAHTFLPASIQMIPEYKPKGSVNLLQYYAYNPEERDQGTCGNCWVWSGTASAAIQHGIKNSITDDLSVQLFNSYYQSGGTDTVGACCGGFMDVFADVYEKIGYFIPLTNKGAEYYDRNATTCKSQKQLNEIDTNFSYPIKSINYGAIDTTSSNSDAIINIKRMLDSGYPVDIAAYFTSEEYTAFNNFWSLYTEDYLFQWGGVEANRTNSGGHEMLIIGYEDDTVLPYWEILNSWGTADGNRTRGTFRMPQNIDYVNSYVNIGGERYAQFTFDVVDVEFENYSPVPTQTPDPSVPLTASFSLDKSSGVIPLFVNFTSSSTGAPEHWNWDFGDNSYSTLKNPRHLYMVPGNYNVTLSVTRGGLTSVTMPVTIHVKPPYQPVKAFPDEKGGSYPVPTDDDDDGLFEDINGNGWLEYGDPKLLFEQISYAINSEPVTQFDFDGSGFIGYGDVVKLYQMV
ncbi:PKD domain-containing protein [Methanospirillum stamsii]|uniref:PKD domain-containing protein n=1 Tax=Methanospirillum stamsii TaxID=1277351 RepID=A0A2V2NG78_9EURY|nr:PKD domain-containing protein [Methanospirillum stamsii]PWR74611.1 hypothetical protein DLD82_08500 [Methanospirillum stamsii]